VPSDYGPKPHSSSHTITRAHIWFGCYCEDLLNYQQAVTAKKLQRASALFLVTIAGKQGCVHSARKLRFALRAGYDRAVSLELCQPFSVIPSKEVLLLRQDVCPPDAKTCRPYQAGAARKLSAYPPTVLFTRRSYSLLRAYRKSAHSLR
jgi:hypothetical protein